jgi:hypothetical protein
MNVTAALYRAAHGYEGGMATLAGFLGVSEHSLQHKVSPTYATAHCSPEEVVRICEVTGDLGPVQAMASRLGQMVMPMPTASGVDGDLVHKLADTCKKFGEMISEISGDLADGRVTPNELARIEREAGQLIGAVHTLLSHANAMAEASRPKSPNLRAA